MANREIIDVVIVGAGPAGLSTALHLLQDQPGWADRILVLEKKTHPRHKLCGGGITRAGLKILQRLGLPFPLPLPQVQVDHIYIRYKKRTIHVRGKPQFVVINRPEFDHFLLQTARQRGIRVREDEPVRALERANGFIQVTTSQGKYLARVVVGADSARGVTRAWLEGSRETGKGNRRIGRTLETLEPAHQNAPRFRQHSAIFDFSYIHQDLQGYFWDFPSCVSGEPTHNRGVYDARFVHHRPKARLPVLLNQGVKEFGSSLPDLQPQSAPIRWFSPTQAISAGNLILVGDAAGVEGLFGEGISPALAYGKVAAAEIRRAFNSQDFSFRSYERHILRSSLGRYLLIRWLVASALYRFGGSPLFMHPLWTAGQILATIWRAGPVD
jgi:flavin-dependent dehydrogenase